MNYFPTTKYVGNFWSSFYGDYIRVSKQGGTLKIEKVGVPPVEHKGEVTYEGYGLKVISDDNSTTIIETQYPYTLK